MAIEDFDQVTIAPAKLRPFSKFIMSIGELPTSYLDSLSYAEQVTWFCNYLQDKVIPAINNNAEALEEVQNLYIQLKQYVDDYFNTGFPEEISNKLDEMATDGTLENLLNDPAHLIKVYDTYTQLIADSETFTNGLRLKTMGYYSIGDGGNAEYIVTNTQNTKKYQITLENSLYLELILNNDEINVKQIGAYGNGTDNDSSILNNLFDFIKDSLINVFIPDGTYLLDEPLNIYGGPAGDKIVTVRGSGSFGTILKASTNLVGNVINLKSQENEQCRIILKDLYINGNNTAVNGLNIYNIVTNSIFKNITIRYCTNYGLTNEPTRANVYLTTFDKIRVDYCATGIYIRPPQNGSNTSLMIINCYVQGCTNGYYLNGIYSNLINCCADGVTNFVYEFNYWAGAVINCGSECQALQVYRFIHSTSTLVNPWAFGNKTDAEAVQIACGSGSHINVQGGKLLVENDGISTFPGALYSVGSDCSLELNDVVINSYETAHTFNVQRPITSNNFYGNLTLRDGGRLAYIGRDTEPTSGLVNNKDINNPVKANAIFFGLGNSYIQREDGTNLQYARHNMQGDILLSRNPATIGGIGWIQSQTTDGNWSTGKYLKIPVIMSGTTEERPTTNLMAGQMYFDTTLGYPIWFKSGSTWVNSSGTSV